MKSRMFILNNIINKYKCLFLYFRGLSVYQNHSDKVQPWLCCPSSVSIILLYQRFFIHTSEITFNVGDLSVSHLKGTRTKYEGAH